MFYDNLVKACAGKGVKLTPLVQRLGMSRGNISNWKNGTVPGGDVIAKLAAALDTTVGNLLGIENENTPAAPKNSKGKWIPVLGRVAAGIPIEAIEDIIDYEEISEKMAAYGDYFALEIHGQSMEPKMSEGDVVIVRKQEYADNGDTVIALVNGSDAT